MGAVGEAMASAEGRRQDRLTGFTASALLCLLLANCASSEKFGAKVDPKYGVASSPRVIDPGEPVPKGGGTYRVGKPYTVAGRTYTPEENADYREEGLASWYGDDFHGRLTANGEIFDKESISAAHPTLPLPSYVRVTNLANGRSIIVRVNDRGPYARNRIIDLSHKTANLLAFHNHGVARVRVEYVGRASLDGSDDRKLMATLRKGEPAPAPSIMVASAGPFIGSLPEMRAGKTTGAVPVPSERPYRLGDMESDSKTVELGRGLEMSATQRLRQTAKLETAAEPVSAYAPVRYDAPAAFISGRGLY